MRLKYEIRIHQIEVLKLMGGKQSAACPVPEGVVTLGVNIENADLGVIGIFMNPYRRHYIKL